MESVDQKIDRLERISKRLERRAPKKRSAVISPYPISGVVTGEIVKGIIMSYMFPCDGTITKGAIDLGKKPKQDIRVDLSIFGEITGTTRTYTLSKRKIIVEPSIPITEFDRLMMTMSYTANRDEDNITEVWTSLLWVPTIKDADVKSFLIKDLEDA